MQGNFLRGDYCLIDITKSSQRANTLFFNLKENGEEDLKTIAILLTGGDLYGDGCRLEGSPA